MSCCAHAPRGAAAQASQQLHHASPNWLRLVFAAFIAGNSMALSLAVNLAETDPTERGVICAALAIGACAVAWLVGRPLLQACAASLASRRLGIEVLFVASLCGACALSVHSMVTCDGAVYFEVVGLLLVIFAWGQNLKASAQAKVLASLRDQAPASIQCTRINLVTRTHTPCLRTDVRAGDVLLVSEGETIAVDGEIIEGRAFVNTAVMTGEGLCVSSTVGDAVQAGTQVVDGPLVIRACVDGHQTQVDAIKGDIIRGLMARSSWERAADRWAQRLVPCVMLTCLATFAYWTHHASLHEGLLNAMAVLLVACPCAFFFATPTAVWAGVIGLGRFGLHTRNAAALERLAQVDTLVFDKTGTLTAVDTTVTDWVFVPAHRNDALYIKALSRMAQQLSNHPIAASFKEAGDAVEKASATMVPLSSRVLSGVGIEAHIRVGAKEVTVALGEANGLLPDTQMHLWRSLHTALDPALRHICIVVDGVLVAAAGIRDTLFVDSPRLFQDAADAKLQTHVFSGDRAGRVALLKHPQARAEMTPAQKKDAVSDLHHAGRKVCFIGDGLNDAQAMSVSHVSIAIDAGAPLTVETADFVLAQTHVVDVARAATLARRCAHVVRSNLVIALCYNAFAMSIAALGFIHPIFAALMMLCASMTVTLRVAWHMG